jgi:hypothetical protein
VSIVLDLQSANAVANKKKVVVSVGERGQWLCDPARCAALHLGSERDPSSSSICSSAGSMAISHDVGAPLSLRLGGVELLEAARAQRIQHHAGEDRPRACKWDCRTDAPGLVPVRETRAMLTARKLVQGCSRPPSERPWIHPSPSHDGASRCGALIRLNRHGAVATLHVAGGEQHESSRSLASCNRRRTRWQSGADRRCHLRRSRVLDGPAPVPGCSSRHAGDCLRNYMFACTNWSTAHADCGFPGCLEGVRS